MGSTRINMIRHIMSVLRGVGHIGYTDSARTDGRGRARPPVGKMQLFLCVFVQ